MPAANTDKMKKKKSRFQTTLNGGITAGDTSLTLNDGSGLPTDTAVVFVINRVDANGTPTPSLMEAVTGIVSGNTVSDLLRGKDGTSAKSHANGSVVEIVWDGETWNDFVDLWLTEHNQAGIHTGPTTETYSPDAAATATLDAGVANRHQIQMPAGNITIAIENEKVGQEIWLEITQDATGGRTVTWFSTIRWVDGATPVLSTGANKRDTFIIVVTGSGTYDGYVVGQNI